MRLKGEPHSEEAERQYGISWSYPPGVLSEGELTYPDTGDDAGRIGPHLQWPAQGQRDRGQLPVPAGRRPDRTRHLASRPQLLVLIPEIRQTERRHGGRYRPERRAGA